MADIQSIDFHGEPISTCRDERNGKVYCIPKEISERFGVNWASQYAKLNKHRILSKGIVKITIPSPGGAQEVIALDVDLLPAWLFTFDLNKLDDTIAVKIEQYQKECASVLRDYWFTGAAISPQTSLPQVRNPANQMLIDTIVRLDEVEQRALCAEQAAHAADLRATRAETKADMALDDAHRMTIEEFILVNGLIRQFPHSKHGEYARWLGDFCLQYTLKTPKAPVLGKSWDKEKSYPLQALAAWLRYEQRRPQQITLVRPPDEGRSHV